MTISDFEPAKSTEAINCPVCNSNRYTILFEAGDYEYELPGTFYIAQCDSCGLLYQNPRPPFNEICRYYTEKYEPYRKVGSLLMQKLRYRFLVQPRIKKYKKLFQAKSDQIKVLDVGCADGGLLYELSLDKKFDCYGIEPIKYIADIAINKGLKVSCSTLENYECDNEYFDLIIMNHVIEHLPNPEEVMKKIFKLLKKDGYFCGETPCSDALEKFIFLKYWAIYHLPRHLTFFSTKLMIKFLQKFGFKEINIYLQPMPSCWQASIRNYLLSKKYEKKIVKIFSGHSVLLNLASYPFIYILSKLGYASIMHFVAQK